jgi:hypothetical protein
MIHLEFEDTKGVFRSHKSKKDRQYKPDILFKNTDKTCIPNMYS